MDTYIFYILGSLGIVLVAAVCLGIFVARAYMREPKRWLAALSLISLIVLVVAAWAPWMGGNSYDSDMIETCKDVQENGGPDFHTVGRYWAPFGRWVVDCRGSWFTSVFGVTSYVTTK